MNLSFEPDCNNIDLSLKVDKYNRICLSLNYSSYPEGMLGSGPVKGLAVGCIGMAEKWLSSQISEMATVLKVIQNSTVHHDSGAEGSSVFLFKM